ncbi:MAG: hypothetical protein C0505_03020 [Leptothrix sp. (in: Bacteria)]|nr:hypothetical protein [Leptothrix sp. (in: b-proteobacteria)]
MPADPDEPGTDTAQHEPGGRARSGELLQLFFDQTGEGISVFDADWRLQVWNQRFLDFTGLPPELAVAGAPLGELLLAMARLGEFGPGDAEAEAARRLAQLCAGTPSVTQRTRPNGRSIELRRTLRPGGGFVMLYAEVTERLRTEARLRQTTELLAQKSGVLEATLQSLPLGVLTIDAGGRITAWNLRALELLQLTEAVLHSHPTLAELSRHQAEHGLIEVGAFSGLERPPLYQHTRRDGVVLEVRTSHCDDGSVVRTYSDVTASVLAQRTLTESERRFRTLADAAPALIWLSGPDHRPAWFNQRWLQHTGRTLEEELACAWPERIVAEDLEACRAAYRTAAPLRAAYEVEYRLRNADGSLRWIADKGIPRLADDGSFQGYIVYGWDITERKAHEAALGAAKDEAERANRAKCEFLSRMSHELRTPLNAVLGFAQLLQADTDEPLSPRQHARVNEMLLGGRHLLSLINDVLDLARIEVGAVQLQLGAVELQALVDDCLPLVRAAADARGISLRIRPPPLGVCHVSADPTRLRQVLLNLLSNAVKYNRPAGRVELAWSGDAEGATVKLEVHDSGPGISAAHQSRLFQAFERLDADRTDIEGAGIGLALSKWLVELMQGSIGVRSEPGQGSTFWVQLRCAEAPGAALKAPGGAGTAPDPASAPPAKTVLYIEDNVVNQVLMEGMLAQRPGLALRIAGLPEEGLAMATENPPDLVLLDIQLPGIDGFEVLRRLRAEAATRHLPVVAVSANAMHSDLDDARRAGFADYVTKPLDLVRLLAVVDGLLGPQSAAAPEPRGE